MPPFTLLVVLANFTSGDQHLCVFVTVQTTTPSELGRAGTADDRFARDDNELEPQLGGRGGGGIPGVRLRETAGT
jgi:hypothetical protein